MKVIDLRKILELIDKDDANVNIRAYVLDGHVTTELNAHNLSVEGNSLIIGVDYDDALAFTED